MSERYYICGMVGSGTQDDPFRPEIAAEAMFLPVIPPSSFPSGYEAPKRIGMLPSRPGICPYCGRDFTGSKDPARSVEVHIANLVRRGDPTHLQEA